jgi:hypothetical protein
MPTVIHAKNRFKAAPQADVDPAVEELASLIQRSKLSDAQIAAKVGEHRHSRMSVSTVTKIRELETKRPSNFTLTWIGWVLGFRREWRPL